MGEMQRTAVCDAQLALNFIEISVRRLGEVLQESTDCGTVGQTWRVFTIRNKKIAEGK